MAVSALPLPPVAEPPSDGVLSSPASESGQKRGVEDALLSGPQPQPPRRRRLVSSTAEFQIPAFLDLSPPRSVRAPEPSSINSIIREHSRSRLYVSPLHWISQHLQLLDCQFVLKKTAKQKHEESSQEERQRLGSTDQSSCSKSKALGNRQHFDQRVVSALKTDGAFSCSSSRSTAPSLAYLDLETLGSRRDKSVRFSSSNRVNPPIASLREKRQRQLRPLIEVEDPYIAAVLIALAQGRRRQRDASEKEDTNRAEAPVQYDLPEEPSSTALSSEAAKGNLPYFKLASLPRFLIDLIDRLGIPRADLLSFGINEFLWHREPG
ncbi:hypothetical protein F66182_9207 [Fusarium sp. NRRL 66182]|nr:hypothetical protein F66182_9207 [Fusarium sp. NRRL 66182]